MNRFMVGLVILLVIVIGAYFLVFNNGDNKSDLTLKKGMISR
ncbi:hypothetical protein JNUCC1_01114 [Lentibacillus sp. JNUCC-1]|nr:hypothetical protein [Lentibacillus sp. JNUCC-1]